MVTFKRKIKRYNHLNHKGEWFPFVCFSFPVKIAVANLIIGSQFICPSFPHFCPEHNFEKYLRYQFE